MSNPDNHHPSARNPISPLRAWILAARPKTLPAAVAPVLVGTALAFNDHLVAVPLALVTLATALLLQIGVNLANDYFDHIKGIDTENRLGPIRVTHSGLIPATRVKSAMVLTFLAAGAMGIYLITVGGWPVILIGAACILAALAYSGGPYPLASHGLGDLSAFLFFGWVAVCGTYYLQTLRVTPMALLMGSLVGLLITAILVVNNLRDIATDRKSGKITLAVRLGERGSKLEYLLLLTGSYIPLPLLWLGGWKPLWILLPLLSLPMAVALGRNIWRSNGGQQSGYRLNRLLAATAGLSLLYSCLLVVGLVIS